jgi:hypothetical protein
VATKGSARALIDAHVELGKAEMGEIAGKIKKIAAFSGVAVAAAIGASLLLLVGLPLFLGEWIFGSMGWGLLHGLLFLTAIIVAMVLLVIDMPAARIGAAYLVGIVVAVGVGLVLGLNLTNRLWGFAGDALLPQAAPDVRPLAAAMVVLPLGLAVLSGLAGLAGGLLGRDEGTPPPGLGSAAVLAAPAAIYGGWLAAFWYAYMSGIAWFDWALLAVGVAVAIAIALTLAVASRSRPGRGLLGGMSGGALVGVLLALLTSIAFGPRVGVAMAVTLGLLAWIAAMAVAAMRREGFDFDAYGRSFKPQQTIDMTKETIEWARRRMPLSRGS